MQAMPTAIGAGSAATRIGEITVAEWVLRYVGRGASASPAAGSYKIHKVEQKKLFEEALTVHVQL